MKKTHLLPCLLFNLLMVGACSFEPSNPKDQFLIKGKLTNVPDSILVELLMSEGQMMRTVAKTVHSTSKKGCMLFPKSMHPF